jgi:hypothetical protein
MCLDQCNPSRFGSRRRHIQGVSSELLAFQHVKWFPANVRPRVTDDSLFLKLPGVRPDNYNFKVLKY